MYCIKTDSGQYLGRMSLVAAVLKMRACDNIVSVHRVIEGLSDATWPEVRLHDGSDGEWLRHVKCLNGCSGY